MIEHSVFALPFAYIAALTAMAGLPQPLGTAELAGAMPVFHSESWIRWGDLALITVAMVAARTVAMAANRVIDRELDARNPRTAQRELVTGAVSLRTAVVGALVALAVFLGAAAALNPLCLALAPLALVPLVGYPYGKRFTWGCHFILGLAQAIVPVAAWLAVTGEWSATPVVLGLAVGTWVSGFDLIYACQDIASDRREGVHSLPARFGAAAALRWSATLHTATVALLVAFGFLADLDVWWWVGVAGTAVALAYEHTIVRPDDLSRVNRAFFTVNGWVGIGLLTFAALDLALR